MKKNLFYALAVFAFAGLFASCEKPEQSELTLDDVQGVATIQGKVTYDAGFKEENKVFINDNELPAVGAVVVARVPNRAYLDADGMEVYTDTVDANGMYTISFPVDDNGINEVVLEVLPFYATYNVANFKDYSVKPMENQLYNFAKLKDYGYALSDYTFGFNDKNVLEVNIILSCNPIQELELKEEITITGEVLLERGWKKTEDKDATSDQTDYFSVESDVVLGGAPMEIMVQFPYNDKYYSMVYDENIVTGEDGKYSAKIKIPADLDYNNIEISVAPKTYLGTYAHKYWNVEKGQWYSQDVDVIYAYYGSNVDIKLSDKDGLLKTCNVEKIYMSVEPSTEAVKETIKGIGNKIDFDKETGDRLYHTWYNVISYAWQGDEFGVY